MTKEQKYFVKGTHCASCEILIEKKLLEEKNIKAVEASNQKGEVLVEYEGEKPSANYLNKLFQKDGYTFSETTSNKPASNYNIIMALITGGFVFLVFLFLNKLGLARWVNVGEASSLPTFFLFGLLAGLSTCAALVGGLVLSMSKQWNEVYANEKNFKGKYMPLIIGALTFFLPCGFTITAQSLALISGSFLQGSLIMLAFAAGTLPVLLSIC